MMNCVSPSYARKYGVPRSLADLQRHQLVHYSLNLGGDEASFEYFSDNNWHSTVMRSVVTVNNTDAYRQACIAGLGIMQAPRIGLDVLIKSGQLLEVLPEFTCQPMPVSLVHSKSRALPKRVRTVMNFIAEAIAPALLAS
jgi:DNA-binding transcriptional LysR family regulator